MKLGKFKILICDDEKEFGDLFHEKLTLELAQYDLETEIHVQTQVHQNLGILSMYDVFYIDIEMPECSGFDLARHIYNYNPKAYIIFVTSKQEYVYDSFDFHPFDFIYKGAIDQVLSKKVAQLINALDIRYYQFDYKGIIRKLDYNSIISIQKHGNNLHFITIMGEYKERKSITQILSELNQSELQFIQIHKSIAVNCKFILEIKGGICYLFNGEFIRISRKYLKTAIHHYLIKSK